MQTQATASSTLNPPFATPAADGLRVENLSAGYGKALVLEGLDLVVPRGQVAAVVGPNGAGKSTLVKAISGCIKTRSGQVRFGNESLTGLAPNQIARRGVLHVPETRDIFGGMTVWENLMIAFDNLHPDGDAKQAFGEVYELFPVLAQRKDDIAGNLSGGQQQMLAIGRALLGKPQLLMLDEPSLGLARIVIREIYATLERLRKTGLTVLLIEQNATMAVKFADYSVVVANGRVVLRGTRAELAAEESLVQHYLGGQVH